LCGRRDLHAGQRVQLLDREGQQRGGQRARQHAHGKAGAGEDLGGRLRERLGTAPGVASDDDGRPRPTGAPQPGREPGRRAPHHGDVHPVRPGAHGPAQPCGAEAERVGHAVGEVRAGRLVAGERGDEHML
jgi:hypothetical protein